MAEHNSENFFADIQADRGHFPEKVEDSQALSISDREYVQMWSDILVTISAMLKLLTFSFLICFYRLTGVCWPTAT